MTKIVISWAFCSCGGASFSGVVSGCRCRMETWGNFFEILVDLLPVMLKPDDTL